MKSSLFFSIIFLFLSSCSKKNDNSAKQPPVAMDTLQKTFLALGDSYTIGDSVDETERFPAQTGQLLRQQNIDLANPDIIAVTGWTTANLLNALDDNPPKKNYSIVSLLIGVNNQYQGRSLDAYKNEFTELLSRAIP